MSQLPPDLRASLPEGSVPVAEAWWASLPEADRRRIADLWDERLEVCFFSPQTDAEGCRDEWEEVPVVSGGRFVPSDDDGRHEWQPGYFEHLLQNPDLVLAYDPPRRTFHIGCTQHAAARECLAVRHVPADFVCPVDSASCPMLPLRGAKLSRARQAEQTK